MQIEPVCFFPLFLRNNHFSLLKINHRTRTIHHYDPLILRSRDTSVKIACFKAFPQFRYIEEKVRKQTDNHSCGPIAIKHARLRMLNLLALSVEDGEYEAEALRSDTLIF